MYMYIYIFIYMHVYLYSIATKLISSVSLLVINLIFMSET